MSPLLAGATGITLLLYALALAVALLRMWRGPGAPDRVLALDFASVLGVLVLGVLAIRDGSQNLFEAALLLALCGFVVSLALAKFLLRGEVIE